jgi:hypothetical protein
MSLFLEIVFLFIQTVANESPTYHEENSYLAAYSSQRPGPAKTVVLKSYFFIINVRLG